MFKKRLFGFLYIVLLIFLMTACSEQNVSLTTIPLSPNPEETTADEMAPNTHTPSPTVFPSSTVAVTAMLPTRTATSLPATVTPAPTTPTPLPTPQVAPEIAAWLQTNAIPFDTAVPSDSYQDLMPLKAIIGDARIVSLGESTHGTREFFQMKHRLISFLVKEMGFNVVAMEASWPYSRAVNTYIQTGTGRAEAVVRDMGFWTWDTEEVVDMVTWLRQYNANVSETEQVQFAGFDMQLHDPAADQVITFLEQVDPDARSEIVPNLQCVRRLNNYVSWTPLAVETCQAALQTVYDFLLAREASYVAQSSPAAFADTLQSARILQQAIDLFTAPYEERLITRDRFMAENVAWLLEQAGPEAKIVIWAHNEHINETPGSGAMGTHLQEQFGEDVVSVGLLTHRGTFIAIDYADQSARLNRLTAVPAPPQTFDDALRSSGHPQFLLDLRSAANGSPVADWLNSPQSQRSIGALYTQECPQAHFVSGVPAERFDVLVYLEETTAARPQNAGAAYAGTPTTAEVNLSPSNLAFEEAGVCWIQKRESVADYLVSYLADEGQDESGAIFIRARGTAKDDGETGIFQSLPATAYRGQQVRLTGAVRTSGVTGGAGLFLDVTIGFQLLNYRTATDTLVTGDTEWTVVELVVDVPPDATTIAFGPLLTGRGEAWVDNLTLSLVEPQP